MVIQFNAGKGDVVATVGLLELNSKPMPANSNVMLSGSPIKCAFMVSPRTAM